MPGARARVQGASGGYLIQVNASGFRSDREFDFDRAPGVFRALMFGDSQTAGDGVSNAARFSNLLEVALPGLEVQNYGLAGSGTDQQFLIFQEHASIAHDLVVIALSVENILRVTRRVVKTLDAEGRESFRAKPYFELTRDGLELRGVPVPKQPWTPLSLPDELRPHVYLHGQANYFFRDPSPRHATVMRVLAQFPRVRQFAKWGMTRIRKFQPLPDYDSPSNAGWLLLREILRTWLESADSPVLLVLLPLDSALKGLSDASQYQARFRELCDETGCRLYDPLPELLKLPLRERQLLWSDVYGHLSDKGHAAVARLLTPVLASFMTPR